MQHAQRTVRADEQHDDHDEHEGHEEHTQAQAQRRRGFSASCCPEHEYFEPRGRFYFDSGLYDLDGLRADNSALAGLVSSIERLRAVDAGMETIRRAIGTWEKQFERWFVLQLLERAIDDYRRDDGPRMYVDEFLLQAAERGTETKALADALVAAGATQPAGQYGTLRHRIEVRLSKARAQRAEPMRWRRGSALTTEHSAPTTETTPNTASREMRACPDEKKPTKNTRAGTRTRARRPGS